MFPIIIDFGTWNLPLLGETPIFLPTYGLLFVISLMAAWWWFMRRARGMGLPEETLFNLLFYTVLAGILGAKLLLILLDLRMYVTNPALILGTLRTAGVLIGGVIAGGVVFVLYSRRQGLPTRRLADVLAAPLALAQGIGRLGCYSAGCCWGVPIHEHHPLAVTFTDPRALAQTGVPLYTPLVATQLLQAGADVALAVVLAVLWRRRPEPPGTVAWVYVLLYSLSRGIVEFWRGDIARGLYFGDRISTSQLLALGGAVLAAVMLLRGWLRQRHTSAA